MLSLQQLFLDIKTKIKNVCCVIHELTTRILRQNFFQKTCFSQLFVYTHTISPPAPRTLVTCVLVDTLKLKSAKVHFFAGFLTLKKANATCLNHDFDKIFRISKIIYSTEFTEKTQSCTEKNIANLVNLMKIKVQDKNNQITKSTNNQISILTNQYNYIRYGYTI
jgi:hypothetical protein